MYKEIHIQNFKNFADLLVTGLKRVNLIAGKNAVGKSALLEALYLFGGAYNPGLLQRIIQFRGFVNFPAVRLGPETPWDTFYHNFNTNVPITIAADHLKQGTREISLRILDAAMLKKQGELIEVSSENQPYPEQVFSGTVGLEMVSKSANGEIHSGLLADLTGIRQHPVPPPPFTTIYIPSKAGIGLNEANFYNELEIRGEHQRILLHLKTFEPRLKRLIVSTGPEPILMADVGLKRMIPLNYVSDGIGRIATFIINIAVAKSGIVLIDEIENGIHYAIYEKMWQMIAIVAKDYDVQVFATTHSHEAILAAHNALAKSRSYDFTYQRLDASPNGIRVVNYNRKDMEAAAEINFEVR